MQCIIPWSCSFSLTQELLNIFDIAGAYISPYVLLPFKMIFLYTPVKTCGSVEQKELAIIIL